MEDAKLEMGEGDDDDDESPIIKECSGDAGDAASDSDDHELEHTKKTGRPITFIDDLMNVSTSSGMALAVAIRAGLFYVLKASVTMNKVKYENIVTSERPCCGAQKRPPAALQNRTP